MSLVEDVLGVLPFLRQQAESLMVDTCDVTRPGGVVTDPDTGDVTPASTFVYSGKCKIQQTISQPSNPTAGGHQFTVEDLEWHAPYGAGPFKPGDVITYVSAPLDPQMVGTVYRITALARKTLKTAQRLHIEVIS